MSTLQTATKYFGCDIAVNGQTFKMWGIVPDGVWYTQDRKDKVAKWGEWQAELKPLSEITDEDAVEVGKLADLPESVRRDRWYCDRDNMLLIGREIAYDLHMDLGDPVPISPATAVAIIDLLRSRYYDIDNVLKPQP